MANTQSTQAFYALTLESASAATSAVTCNAIPGLKSGDQQIFEARGQKLFLHRIVENEDRSVIKLSTVVEQDVFGIVRGVAALRIPGTAIDHLAVASDSGRMTLLAYDDDKKAFQKVREETFGKSGVRRTVPGQYLAADPRGRCLMMASVEKNKVVYIMLRNAEGKVVASSPHEANQWATLCYAVVGLDTGWENPVFATLEVDYTDAENDASGEAYAQREKQLVYYTVDLGLNHVVKTWSDKVDYSANQIFAVPGGQDGPSGTLVCCADRIYYYHDKNPPLSIAIPRRQGATEDPNRKRCIVSACMHLKRGQKTWFYLLQTDDGDLFKLTMDYATDAQGRSIMVPEAIILKYYDTLPVAKQLLLNKKGYLYIAAENGNNKLYHVNDLAEDNSVEPWNIFTSYSAKPDPAEELAATYFKPRRLTYLSLALDIPALSPLMRCQVDNLLNEDAPQIYAVQGTGNASAFKVLRHGLDIHEVVSNEIPSIAWDGLYSLRHRASDPYHSYLLLSSTYADKTTVLSITDEVESMDDSPFLTTRATIFARQMGDASLVQVHARGVHTVLENESVIEWPTPAHRTVVAASANQYQLLLGLSSSELAYFFMAENGALNALEDMPEMSGKITALAVAPTPKGRQIAKFAVVGCDDCTVRVVSIDLDTPLEPRTVQAVSAIPTSLELIEQRDPTSGTMLNYVHIGLQSGLYLRAVLDETTGELDDVTSKFLGHKPTRLFRTEIAPGTQAVLASSSRPWLGYNHPQTGMYTLTPLVTPALEAACEFITDPTPNGLCAIQGSNLFIFDVPSIEGRLTTSEVKLNYTPRAMARNPWYPIFYVAQSEGNTLSPASKKEIIAKGGTSAGVVKMELDDDGNPVDEESGEEIERHLGLPRCAGHWASCISAVDPVSMAVTANIELDSNEAALCAVVVPFESKEWECFLAVGTGQHMLALDTDPECKGYVHIYRLIDEGKGLEFVHKTEFELPIYALLPHSGRLAVGIGNELFIYDIGMKALLRKSRGTVVPNQIVSLQSNGNRIVCGDVSEGVTYVVFKPKYNRMIPFVDDTVQRWTTTTAMLDYETVAGGDKFGNLWIVRCPEEASKEADEEGMGGFIMNERAYLNGAPNRLDLRAHYYAQDIPMSMQRTSLVPGGQEVLFWAGLQGTLGILIPFVDKQDAEFFTSLENHLRTEDPPLAGRDHLMYRSYYAPVKGVIDGDLCERFAALSPDKKMQIAAELQREVKAVEKLVAEKRGRVAF